MTRGEEEGWDEVRAALRDCSRGVHSRIRRSVCGEASRAPWQRPLLTRQQREAMQARSAAGPWGGLSASWQRRQRRRSLSVSDDDDNDYDRDDDYDDIHSPDDHDYYDPDGYDLYGH